MNGVTTPTSKVGVPQLLSATSFTPVSDAPRVTKSFVYLAELDDEPHKGQVSACIVERVKHEKIVAVIRPLGLLNEADTEQEIEDYCKSNGLATTGDWQLIKKGTHRYKRVVRGSFEQ